MIRRWTWLLALPLFLPDDCRTNASHYRNKSKSLSEQIQVIIGWMLKLLGRGQLHHAISRLLGKGTFAIGNQDMGASSNWFLDLDNYTLFRILSLSAFLFRKIVFGWTLFISLWLIANACSLMFEPDHIVRIAVQFWTCCWESKYYQMHQCSAEQSQCWIFHLGLIQVCFLGGWAPSNHQRSRAVLS